MYADNTEEMRTKDKRARRRSSAIESLNRPLDRSSASPYRCVFQLEIESIAHVHARLYNNSIRYLDQAEDSVYPQMRLARRALYIFARGYIAIAEG